MPDSADLSGSDVVARSLFVTGPAGANRDIDLAFDITLAPGWYAIVVGTGAHFATSAGGLVVDGHHMVAGTQPTFTLRPSDGSMQDELKKPQAV
jgi:hypothetical protein